MYIVCIVCMYINICVCMSRRQDSMSSPCIFLGYRFFETWFSTSKMMEEEICGRKGRGKGQEEKEEEGKGKGRGRKKRGRGRKKRRRAKEDRKQCLSPTTRKGRGKGKEERVLMWLEATF